ncbi:MAG: CTP synthase [Planctomycetota bacterium]
MKRAKRHTVKHIFITGGVVSSLGKGLTSASIGALLESRGLRIRIQKLDPYLNVDAGTMNPYQHGEVYVTRDGAETDLDLGHYERFTNALITRDCNVTTGSIYNRVIRKERAGEYHGGTVQVIPHVTDEIKASIRRLVNADADVVITEIGGTVGDIESLPFLEAIRQFGQEVGRGNVLFIHLTLIPYLRAAGEIKTKPTQHSVGTLREIGIQPDILICRTERHISDDARAKIGLFCNLSTDRVFEEMDVTHSIYELPLVLASQKLDQIIVDGLGLRTPPPKIARWRRVLDVIKHPSREVEIAVVGKYITLQDAYKSVDEALRHGGIDNGVLVKIRKIEAESLETGDPARILDGADGILVPGGFGHRGIDGKLRAIRHARTRKVPFLGICLGMQCAAIEFTRNVLHQAGANSTEFDAATPAPVIDLLPDQREVKTIGGTMRLGSYPCVVRHGTRTHRAYRATIVHERHRHRFEVNPAFREKLEAAGLVPSGISPDGRLVEIVELRGHPWFIGTQFHPEFQSKPTRAHPLFRHFIRAALEHGARNRKPKTRRETRA